MPGAFSESLSNWAAKDRLPPILWQHNPTNPIGPFTRMEEDEKGLFVEGKLLIDTVQLAKEAYELLKEKDLVLPVLSNQKMNAYIKEIATLAGISKNLTFHLARHTFATTVTLSNGVPIESVSKMLGHTSLKTTQIYAKVLDSKISDDMEKLKNDPALLEFAKSI